MLRKEARLWLIHNVCQAARSPLKKGEIIMIDRFLARLGAACGILYVVLAELGWDVLGGGGGPDTGASPEEIGAYYSGLPAPGVMDCVAMSLVVLGFLCFMVF